MTATTDDEEYDDGDGATGDCAKGYDDDDDGDGRRWRRLKTTTMATA